MSPNGPDSSWTTSTLVDEHQEDPIPLGSRIIHRFYEPVILYVALALDMNERGIAVSPQADAPIDINDKRAVFEAFVNKLAHICDKEKGGDTVTSFMVLQGNSKKVHFRFAANRQGPDDLGATIKFVKKILLKVAQAPTSSGEQLDSRSDLLSDIARFCRPRISLYLRDLQPRIAECLKRCNGDDNGNSWLVAQELTKIVDSANAGASLAAREIDYIRQFETTIRLLITLCQSNAAGIIEERAREGRMHGFESAACWSELLHTIRRILAYPQSVQFFLLAKRLWPELFDAPEVSFVQSSVPMPKPIRNKSLTAESIVGRMTRKEKQIQIFRDFVRILQLFGLDERIRAEYAKDTFRPIVHSEILLLNSLLSQGDINQSMFFNEWKYIGSSKPTCRLCQYYFDEERSEVGHRPCHGNLYPSWRVPDVFPSQGSPAFSKRQIMVDRVLERIRKDTFDIVRKKVPPTYKEDDSNTFSAMVTLEERWSLNGSTADEDDIASLMEQLGMEDYAACEQFDDDDGGVAL